MEIPEISNGTDLLGTRETIETLLPQQKWKD